MTDPVRMALFLVAYVLPGAFAIWSIVRLFRNGSAGRAYQWQRAFGWLALCVLPFPFVQLVRDALGLGTVSFQDLGTQCAILPGSWYVLFGGQTVVHVFEENVKAWTGHRQSTMLDNAYVFFALVFVQGVLLTGLVAWRLQAGKRLRDPVVLAAGVFVAVNAALATPWVWFGT